MVYSSESNRNKASKYNTFQKKDANKIYLASQTQEIHIIRILMITDRFHKLHWQYLSIYVGSMYISNRYQQWRGYTDVILFLLQSKSFGLFCKKIHCHNGADVN